MSSNLYERIKNFYDSSSGLWETVWGEHMHHGYYGQDGTLKKERRQAQVDLIGELLQWGGIDHAEHILDVGCGIGGSTVYLAGQFNCRGTGISLSPVQVNRARERGKASGLEDRLHFEVANALHMPYPDHHFDLVWSLESGEHMPEKEKFLSECYRVLKPGGTFLMATWCHRPIHEHPLTGDELKHLQAIYQVYCLPYVLSLPQYAQIAKETGFHHVRTDDWSLAVAPFWNKVIQSALTPAAVLGLLRCGWMTIQAALSLRLMQEGYERGWVRFGLLYGIK